LGEKVVWRERTGEFRELHEGVIGSELDQKTLQGVSFGKIGGFWGKKELALSEDEGGACMSRGKR